MKPLTKLFVCLSVAFICFSFKICAQDTIIPKEEIVTFYEQFPVFIGGDKALEEYLAKNIEIPESEKGKTGDVFVRFVVAKDGSIRNVELIRGMKDSPVLTKEVLRVITKMPKWRPGKQSGELINAQMQMPVRFPLKKTGK